MTIRGCLALHSIRVKALDEWKKEREKKKERKKEENEDDKTRFSPLSGSSLLAIRSSMLCCCRVGATLESRYNSL